jgi:hypothetical protein
MGSISRPLGKLAAAVVCLIAFAGGSPARAAIIDYAAIGVVTPVTPGLSSDPVRLDFTFPGTFDYVQSISIGGTFATIFSNGLWNAFDRITFTVGLNGPSGLIYSTGNISKKSTFNLPMYPAPSDGTVVGDTLVRTSTYSDPNAFINLVLADLSTTGKVSIYFTPLTRTGNSGYSQFQLNSATLYVTGIDTPIPTNSAPVPAGGLLFCSGAILVWYSGRRGRPKS